MRGYPKHLNTKQDVENLIKDHPEFKENLRQNLNKILNEPDYSTEAFGLIDGIETVANENQNSATPPKNTRQILTPNPTWKVMGYRNKGELQSIRDKL